MVPIAARSDDDQSVFSYWVPGSSSLLQVSSRARFGGDQIAAKARLEELLAREPLDAVSVLTAVTVPTSDFAACKGTDQEGVIWVYAYAVWPDLSIMILASGDAREMANEGNWVYEGIRSLRLVGVDPPRA